MVIIFNKKNENRSLDYVEVIEKELDEHRTLNGNMWRKNINLQNQNNDLLEKVTQLQNKVDIYEKANEKNKSLGAGTLAISSHAERKANKV